MSHPSVPSPDSALPTGDAIGVRRAERRDAAAVAAIYNEYVGRGTATLEMEPWTEQRVVDWIESAGPRQCLFVAEADRRILGWAQLKRYSDRGGYAAAAEVAEYLSHDATGRGAGSALLAAVLGFADEQGFRHLVAKIIAGNTGSIDFHARHGFTTVGTQTAIGEVDGRLIDITIMQRLHGV